jgi:hypothetical protein
MTWFPSLRTSVLILLTIIIETGLIILYGICQSFESDIIFQLAMLVIAANVITGTIGWLIQNLRG